MSNGKNIQLEIDEVQSILKKFTEERENIELTKNNVTELLEVEVPTNIDITEVNPVVQDLKEKMADLAKKMNECMEILNNFANEQTERYRSEAEQSSSTISKIGSSLE